MTDFGSMADSEDSVGRMLGVLRFWFTKDLVCLVTSFLEYG